MKYNIHKLEISFGVSEFEKGIDINIELFWIFCQTFTEVFLGKASTSFYNESKLRVYSRVQANAH